MLSGSKIAFFLKAYLILVALTLLWAYADPLFSRPDEIPDVYRAESIVRGQLLGPPSPKASLYNSEVIVRVPATLKSINPAVDYYCYYNPDNRGPYKCPLKFSNASGYINVVTNEGRYSPTYFFLAGLPTLISPSSGGIIATRVISAFIDCFYLALALTLVSYRKNPVIMAGLMAAITPSVMFYDGSLNPNGFENAAFISAWTAVAALTTINMQDPAFDKELSFAVFVLGFSLTTGVTARASSPAWAGFVIVIWVLIARRKILMLYAKTKAIKFWTIAFAISAITSINYIYWAQAYIIMRPAFGPSNSRLVAIEDIVIHPLGEALKSIIAEFGVYPADVWLPIVYYFLWISLLAVALVIVFAKVDNFKRIALLILVFSPILVPSAIELVSPQNLMWFPWLGRYEMPGTLGLAVIVGYELSVVKFKRSTMPIVKMSVVRLIELSSFLYLCILFFIQLLSIWWDLRHYLVGEASPFEVLEKSSPLGFPFPVEVFFLLLVVAGYNLFKFYFGENVALPDK